MPYSSSLFNLVKNAGFMLIRCHRHMFMWDWTKARELMTSVRVCLKIVLSLLKLILFKVRSSSSSSFLCNLNVYIAEIPLRSFHLQNVSSVPPILVKQPTFHWFLLGAMVDCKCIKYKFVQSFRSILFCIPFKENFNGALWVQEICSGQLAVLE